MNHKKLVITALLWLFLVSSPVLASPSNANELLALKKIETYINDLRVLLLFCTPQRGVQNFICYLWIIIR
jgi:hypothetical protein